MKNLWEMKRRGGYRVGDEEAMGRGSEKKSEIERRMIWNIVGRANLTWLYLGKSKNFLSTSKENKRKMIDMCKRNLITKDSREDRRISLRLQAINKLWYWMLDNFHTPFKFVRHRLKKEIWKKKKIYIWSGEREREREREREDLSVEYKILDSTI